MEILKCSNFKTMVVNILGAQIYTPVTRRQPTRKRKQMQMKSKGIHREKIPVWEPLATDQTDLWQVVHRQVFIKLIRDKLFPDRYLHLLPAC